MIWALRTAFKIFNQKNVIFSFGKGAEIVVEFEGGGKKCGGCFAGIFLKDH